MYENARTNVKRNNSNNVAFTINIGVLQRSVKNLLLSIVLEALSLVSAAHENVFIVTFDLTMLTESTDELLSKLEIWKKRYLEAKRNYSENV